MMRRLSWGTVAALTIAFSAGAAIALAYSVRENARSHPIAVGPAFPEDMPFDFASERVRTAFAEYARFYDGLPPIADGCNRGSGEVYRVAVEATMSPSMDYAAIDVVASGDHAWVEVRTPSLKAREWHLDSRRVVGLHEIDILRERADRLLISNIPPAVGDRAVDVDEWTIEMCARGRYHFYQRHYPSGDKDANAPFIAFTDTVMTLRRGIDHGP
jgi:hypothetical protein